MVTGVPTLTFVLKQHARAQCCRPKRIACVRTSRCASQPTLVARLNVERGKSDKTLNDPVDLRYVPRYGVRSSRDRSLYTSFILSAARNLRPRQWVTFTDVMSIPGSDGVFFVDITKYPLFPDFTTDLLQFRRLCHYLAARPDLKLR